LTSSQVLERIVKSAKVLIFIYRLIIWLFTVILYHLNNSGEAVGKIGASQIADLRVNYRRYV
jgi:hypothetical protein